MTIPIIVLEELVALCDHPDAGKSRNAKAALAFLDSFKGPAKLRLTSLQASGKQLEGFAMRSEPSSLGMGMKTNDDIILQTCRGLKSKNPVLISDDINMRLKGKAMGITMLTLRGLFNLL
jgi:predicted ribonuclease YlaK